MRNIDVKAVNLDFLGRVWKNQVAPAHTTTAKQIVIEKTLACKHFRKEKNLFEAGKS